MASSSTPEHHNRGNKGSAVVLHPNSQRAGSSASSLDETATLKMADSTDTLKDNDIKNIPAQQFDNISVPSAGQGYDARPHLSSSALITSGAPPHFWADSSCHDDDPPSQLSGVNMNLSLASSTSGGGIAEQHPTPPPVPPHGRPNILSSPPASCHTESILLAGLQPASILQTSSTSIKESIKFITKLFQIIV